MQLLSFVFVLFSFAAAFHSFRSAHHHRLRLLADESSSIPSMSTLSLPSSTPSILPSISLSSLSIPLSPSSQSPPSASAQSTSTSTSTPPSNPSTSTQPSASSSPSSVALPSSTTASSAASASAVTSTSSAPSAPVAVAQPQPSSSSTPINFFTGAGAPTQDSSSSVFLTLSTATPSSTATQSSSSGFFSNTGAVAGTFTVVGLVSIAGVIAVALLIARRRHSRSYEQDTEYLDKSPDLSDDPPMRHVMSTDDGSTSDHAHYGSSPMALAAPPVAYYPDHAYALHPQAFSAEGYPPSGSHGYPSAYPVTYTQDYPAQRIYSPEDYDIAYPPQVPRGDANMHNPHEFIDVELDSSPVPPTQTALPNSLRPSVKSISAAPKQWASTRYSLDSFYSGTPTDAPPSPGQAL